MTCTRASISPTNALIEPTPSPTPAEVAVQTGRDLESGRRIRGVGPGPLRRGFSSIRGDHKLSGCGHGRTVVGARAIEVPGPSADNCAVATAAVRPYRQRPREDEELRAVLERALDLRPSDQLRLYEELRDYLGRAAGQSADDEKISRQLAALAVLERVRDHLGLASEDAPTMAQFDRAAREMGLGWSAQRVGRAFDGYKQAAAVARGERPRPSAGQEAKRRATVGRGRSHEEYIAALRIWMDSKPLGDSTRDYDAFVRSYNPKAAKPLPLSSALKKGLTLYWLDCLRVARREIDYADAVRKDIADRGARTDGPDDLIGIREVGLMLDLKTTNAWNLTRTRGFPPPALTLSGKRIFLRDHVAAYVKGRRQWKERPDFLRDKYYDSKRVAEMIGMRSALMSKRRPESQAPRRTGMASGKAYWLAAEVEAWLDAHRELVGARKARR